MKKATLINLKKVSSYLKDSKRKYVSLDMLSKGVGIYQDVLADDLSFINPVLFIDPSVNMKNLLPSIGEAIYLEENKKKKDENIHRDVVRKKEINEYENIASFVYAKMTNVGGLVDTSLTLSDHDLNLLKKLVLREIASRKKQKNTKRK